MDHTGRTRLALFGGVKWKLLHEASAWIHDILGSTVPSSTEILTIMTMVEAMTYLPISIQQDEGRCLC